MRFTLRELVLIGVFGALWGVVETTLGSVLHLAHVPFKGMLLGCFGVTVLLVGRMFVPRRGASLGIGIVTAILKMFSVGQFVLNPMIAILMEALLAECVLTLSGPPSRRSFLAAGGLAASWNFFHPILTWGILAGQGVFTLWRDTIESGAQTLGMSADAPLLIVVSLLGIHILSGLIAGWIGWQVGQRAIARQSNLFHRRVTST